MTLSMKVFDDKGKELLAKAFSGTKNSIKRNAARFPGLTGAIYYDLSKHGKVQINGPDGRIVYELKETP